jgi:hypothetical protein
VKVWKRSLDRFEAARVFSGVGVAVLTWQMGAKRARDIEDGGMVVVD